MTSKQQTRQAMKIARMLFQAFYGRIYTKDISLYECGSDGTGIDYVLFKNEYTGKHYRITGTPKYGDYVIDEVDFE